jgi:AraC family transcriptional regulator
MMRLPPGTVSGRTLSTRHLAGLILTEMAFAAGSVVPRHAHENAFFRLILDGTSTDASARQDATGGAGSMVFHPPGEPHSNVWHRAGRAFLVELGAAWLGRCGEGAAATPGGAGFAGGAACALALRIHHEFRAPDAASALAVEGLALELLAAVTRRGGATEPGRPRWLLAARDLLRDRFRESVGLADVAAAIDVHPGHLARTFRRHFRCTAGQYVRRLRVEHAAGLLAQTDRPLAEIALDAGFADQSHFATTFRRQIGLTPLAYRRAFGRR